MNIKRAIEIAISFKKGLAFVKGLKNLAQDEKLVNGPEGHWITIGAVENSEGKKEGGRHIYIGANGTIKAGLSKEVQGMTLSEAFTELKKTPEQKEAEKKAKAEAEQGSLLDNGTVKEVKKTEIKDFGEYLTGARKDLYSDLSSKLSKDDIVKKPLSKTWPIETIDEIPDTNTAATVMALRVAIPKKPAASRWYGRSAQERWAQDVQNRRSMAAGLLAVSPDKVDAVSKDFLTDRERRYADVLKELPRSAWPTVIGVDSGYGRLNKDYYAKKSLGFVDLTTDKNKDMWEVAQYNITKLKTTAGEFIALTDSGTSSDVAVKAIADMVQKADPATVKAELDQKKKGYKFNIYWNTKTDKYFIAKQGDRNKTPLKEFDDVKDARLYAETNKTDLAEAYNAIKAMHDVDESKLRFTSNERHGGDYRKGKATDADSYNKAFGFRGVQFGNWIAQSGELSRQNLMDQAYDALHDLANVTGITAKDISLDGTLGLAFGARGVGGKNAALAHYEPDNRVINLTKYGGAGCVAHEWFHAMDNYILGGGIDSYGTEIPYNLKKQSEDLFIAGNNLRRALQSTDFYKAAEKADKYRSKAYWSTIREMAARGFEGYVRSKMAAKGESNNFLVNYDTSSNLWPSKKDLENLTPVYDAYINAIKKAKWDKLAQDELPPEIATYSTKWITIGRGARILIDSNGTIRAGLGGKYNGRQFNEVFKSREVVGEKAPMENPEKEVQEMAIEQNEQARNGAEVYDDLDVTDNTIWL